MTTKPGKNLILFVLAPIGHLRTSCLSWHPEGCLRTDVSPTVLSPVGGGGPSQYSVICVCF